ncbi:hypothetical protein REPUB_Repub12eG0136800 [Reevesia pubescens]
MVMGKVIVSVISIILVVGVILGIAAVVHHNRNAQLSPKIKAKNDSRTKMALDDCKEMMDYAIQSFQGSYHKVLAEIDNHNLRPNGVVAKDGSGQFKTIVMTLVASPKNSEVRYVIYVKAGIYDDIDEYITIDKMTINILILPLSLLLESGDGFIAKSMGFQNTAGPEKHQVMAFCIQSDKSAFFDCRMDGYQDTLYNQANHQFFRNCVISSTVDFIFSDSPTII